VKYVVHRRFSAFRALHDQHFSRIQSSPHIAALWPRPEFQFMLLPKVVCARADWNLNSQRYSCRASQAELIEHRRKQFDSYLKAIIKERLPHNALFAFADFLNLHSPYAQGLLALILLANKPLIRLRQTSFPATVLDTTWTP
jgi:hypothetical protein